MHFIVSGQSFAVERQPSRTTYVMYQMSDIGASLDTRYSIYQCFSILSQERKHRVRYTALVWYKLTIFAARVWRMRVS